MFATLLGALPRPTVDEEGEPLASAGDPDADVIEDQIGEAIRAQARAGLEPVTDGRLGDPAFERLGELLTATGGRDRAGVAVLEDWHRTAATAQVAARAAKQALPGPYSVAAQSATTTKARRRRAMAAAEALAEIVASLAAAGCPLVEIDEWRAALVEDPAEIELFAEAHRRLAGGHGSEIHRSLSISRGSLARAAIPVITELPYASLAVNLVGGPDNWYLVRRASREQGVIAGVLSAGEADEAREVMVWGAHYASAGSGRSANRVGVGSAGSWAGLTWEAARRKLERLGEAARLAGMPIGEDLARSLDPRAVSSRRAAMGHPPAPGKDAP